MSILYDGGGTSNDMQVDTDIAAVLASGSGNIDVSGVNFIDIQLISAAAGDTSTVAVLEFSGATPSAANFIRATEVPILAADLVVDGDLLMVGLSTATAYLKQPFPVQFSHTTKTVKLSLSAETAGAKYIRYVLGAGILGKSPISPLPVVDAAGNAFLSTIDSAVTDISLAIFSEDDPFSPTSNGMQILVVRKDTGAMPGSAADGDYTPLQTDATGQLRTRDDDLLTSMGAVGGAADVDGAQREQLRYIGENIDQVAILFDEVSATASWGESADATGLTQETDHVPEYGAIKSLSFDKDGTTVVEASYGKTISSVDASVLPGTATITFFVKRVNYTDIATVFVRVGTDVSNYAEFSIDPVDFTAAVWEHVSISLHGGVTTGTGLDLAAITYVAIGVTTDLAGDTFSGANGVFFNSIAVHSVSETELAVSGDVTSNAVRVSSVGNNQGGNWPKDAGNTSGSTPRIVIATDDINLAAIKAALASGAPTSGEDLLGESDNTYATVVTAPARQCHYLHVSVGNGGARISIDGGSTVGFYVPANTERLFPNLVIASGAVIQAKKLVDGGTQYTNAFASVW